MLSALILSVVLSGQAAPVVDRDCRDDDGNDRCAVENRAQVLATLGMPSIEDELAAGTEVYRTLQVDGYGNDMAGVAFERRVGASPRVVVYGAGGQRMQAPVSIREWREIQRGAELADRQIVRPEPDPELVICMHAWMSTVEIANAPDREAVRRRTESACESGLTTRYAFDLVSRAIKAFPDCDSLDPDEHRNDAARLKTCVGFRGDRLAAAELMNQVGWRAVPEEGADVERTWLRAFGGNGSVRLDWAGEVVEGGRTFRDNPVALFMMRKTAELEGFRGYVNGYDAVSSTRIETTGRLEFDGADDVTHTAPFRQVWLWSNAVQTWQLDSWTVEPFAPRL